MSLILDALRKADAERERGMVPGLNAQPVPPESVDAPPRGRARPWLWTAVGIGVGLIVAAAGFVLLGGDDQSTNEPPMSARAVPPAPAAVSPADTSRPAAAEAVPVAEPAPWNRPSDRRTRDAERANTDSGDAAPRNDEAPQEVAVLTAPPAPVSRDGLPAHIQPQLPPLNLGGSMFSSNPANRSLIVNGRLLRENDRLTPDLVLEEIKPRAAVFNFKGYRFEVVF